MCWWFWCCLGVFLSVYLLGGDDFAGSCCFAGGAAAFLRIVPYGQS